MRGANNKSTKRKRQLRSQSTDAEAKLWFALRDRRRREQMIVVEVDGGQHAESPEDQTRDTYMQNEGYRVLRFWNTDVLTNCDGVLHSILQTLTKDKL